MTDRAEPECYECSLYTGSDRNPPPHDHPDRAEPGVTPLMAEVAGILRDYFTDTDAEERRRAAEVIIEVVTARLDAATPRPGLAEGMPLPNEEVHVSGRHEDCEVETPHYHRRPIRAALANDKGADPTPEPK